MPFTSHGLNQSPYMNGRSKKIENKNPFFDGLNKNLERNMIKILNET
jgi:hypothetical protein